jgi:hypothetical protein
MKKTLIGMVAGALALGASVIPASAGYGSGNLWDAVQGGCAGDSNDLFEQLVLIGGWAERLDTDGNGKPRYTVFQPTGDVLAAFLDDINMEVSDLAAQPAIVQALLSDHIAAGSFSSNELEDTDLTRITMKSGYLATVFGAGDPVARSVPGDVYVGGTLIVGAGQFDNGWHYCVAGIIDSTTQVPTRGTDTATSPAPATATTESALPDTL